MKVAKITDPEIIDAFNNIPFHIKFPEIFIEQKFEIFIFLIKTVMENGEYEIVDRIIPGDSALFDVSEIKQGHIFVKISD